MSAVRQHAAPERKPARQRPEPQRRRWKVLATPTARAPEPSQHIPLQQLRQAAHPDVQERPLPFRAELAAMFHEELPAVEVLTGPAVEAALDRQGAEAASCGDVLFVRAQPTLPVVAHELAHVLQARRPAQRSGADPEAEAERIEWQASRGGPLPPVQASQSPQLLAFRSQGPLSSPARPTPPAAGGTTAAPVPATATSAPPSADRAQPTPVSPPAPAGAAASALDAAPVPELQEADSAAALAATAALDAAEDADAVLAAFCAAPPSVKAREAPTLDARMAAASARARAAEAQTLPQLRAEMSPGDDLPAAPPVRPPAVAAGALESSAPPPAPLPELAPAPDAGHAAANAALGPTLAREYQPGDPAGLQRSFRAVEVHDSDVDTSAGVRPDVPLVGASDPARIAAQADNGMGQAGAAQMDAARAVLDGPGPERAQLHALSESVPLPPPVNPAAAAPGMPAIAGAAAFAAKPLDATTVMLFDNAHGAAMQASLAGAQAQLDQAAAVREEGRNTELARAQSEQARLNQEADAQQRDEVIARRADIQTARQDALDQQATRGADLQNEAATARAAARDDIDAEVARTETRIDTEFAEAERNANAEVAQGERRASAVRDAAERESENASWWERALDWVKAQLDRLTQAINAVFDAVRAAVRGIIDAVKNAALRLIDAAAGLVRGLIEAFGALLHSLVDRLLSEYFPEIAAALNALIDSAVQAAVQAIDTIATALKAAVEFLAEALASALDAVLAAWQAAANVALTLAAAALTGDWEALARLILTPILLALGIDPEAFFQMFARAGEALDSIVDNPSGFVHNLLETVKGGIGRFADNFPHHLLSGIILWLTGPLGNGIQMPAQFDLFGLLDVARQALGLTLETLRRVAVRVLGESAVEKIEYVLRYVGALISGGWQGLWDQLSSDLAMLRDLVLGQIQEFLLQKVVLASVMWLASMFNPVGALVKLVMTIWNFIQFLRAQLARIFAVAQTVVNSLWQIASGALQPPIAGVERVLAGLLPVVIDLLARLIGVTGVPEKVQKILQGVRQRIETALEKLMRRVLSAFGVRGQPEAGAAAPGEIMAPIRFRAGNETHTLLIADEGDTVRPMIHSTPSPLASWLDARLGQPFTELAAERGWQGSTLSDKRAELQRLVLAAQSEEAGLDSKAEAAEDALNLAAAAHASDAEQAAAAARVAETQAQGEQTRSAVAQVLEFFGITIVPLDQKFADNLTAMASALSGNLRQQVLPRLDVARYTPLDWAGFGAMLGSDGAATEVWRRPANSTGAARRFTDGGFDRAIATEAHRIAVANDLPNAETFLGPAPDFEAARLNQLFGDHLARRLNSSGPAILGQLLAAGGPNYTQLLPQLATPIAEAVAAMAGGDSDAHDHAFARVTGSYFKSEIVNNFRTLMTTASWGSYFHDDSANSAGSGDNAIARPMGFFLRPDPAGSGGSKRASKNSRRLADAVRGADPGQHEWVASRFAAAIIRNAANDVEQGRTEKLDGLCELIQFQHHVRTPTGKLIFKPDGAYPAQKVEIRYQAWGHRMDPAYRNTPEDQLPDAQRAQWYPPGHLHQGDRVFILQGHPGAIYARVSNAAPGPDIKQQTAGHGTWDRDLASTISTELSDGTVLFQEVHDMADNIRNFYKETIWDGRGAPAGNDLYDEYFNSGGGSIQSSALASSFGGYFTRFAAELDAQILRVRGA